MTYVDINYDLRENMWYLMVDGSIMLSYTDQYVTQTAENYGIANKERAFKLLVFEHIQNGLRRCDDSALVKWFLTKTIHYGI